MKFNLKTEAKIIAIALLPIIYLIKIWMSLPTKIPIHWNIDGEVDGWGTKTHLLFMVLFLNGFVYFILLITPIIDPKNRLATIQKKYLSIRLIITLAMSLVSTYIIYSTVNQVVNVSIIFVFIGVMLAVLGNYFQVLPNNYFIGIKTPWTIENDIVWKKTHQLAGKMWVVGGLLIVILNFLVPTIIYQTVFFAIIGILIVVPIVYSYLIFRKLEK
jgi:uncharacterized membrane protein